MIGSKSKITRLICRFENFGKQVCPGLIWSLHRPMKKLGNNFIWAVGEPRGRGRKPNAW